MGKPNFRKLSVVFFPKRTQKQGITALEAFWDKFYKEMSFAEKPELKELLVEYKLESRINDFNFIAMMFIWQHQYTVRREEFKQSWKSRNPELAAALSFMAKNPNVSILIKDNQQTESVSIKSPDIIKAIYGALMQYFKDNFPDKMSFEVWDNSMAEDMIKFVVNITKPTKGRKPINTNIGMYVCIIHSYLQKHTGIKAEEGTVISRIQGRFIFTFLKTFGFVENKIYKEDNIRHLLTKYQENLKEFKSIF